MKTTSLQRIHSICMAAVLGLSTSAGYAQAAPDATKHPMKVKPGKAHLTILPGSDPGTPPYRQQPFALNDRGTVVGNSRQADILGGPPEAPALWSGKGLSLSILPLPAGAPTGGFQRNSANGINNKGVVVGQVAWPVAGWSGDYASHAVRWDKGVPTDLGVVPGFGFSTARAINNAGEIAGFGSSLLIGLVPQTQAVRWTPSGQLQPLDLLPTHTDSLAFGINAAGRVVGYSGFEDGDFTTERRPVYWDGASVTELATPAGFNQGQASAINAAGTIVGQSATFDLDIYDYTGVRATIWTCGVPSLLPLLPGFSASSASSINGRGMAIGACYTDPYGAIYGFGGVPVLWNNGEVTDLRPLLEPFFPQGSQFSVTDINAAGQITGSAVNNGSQGFVLTIHAAAHRH